MSGAASPLVRAGVERFRSAELVGVPLGDAPLAAREGEPTPADVAAIGTTASIAVRGALLEQAMREQGLVRRGATPFPGPEELFADEGWQLGVVLSPWKREVGRSCDSLAPAARVAGVVDTVLRSPAGTIGFNTNTWAAQSALEVLTGASSPASLLVLGAGASARSVLLAIERAFAACEVVVFARSASAAEELCSRFIGRPYEPARDRRGFAVVVNTTTWGETDASEQEPFLLDLSELFLPGTRVFDLNNRIGALQHQALAAGCAVVSGGVMQRVTNACRASLLLHARAIGTVPAEGG